VIEELHKGKKTGLGIEQLRFEYADRLEPMIALLSVTAAMLLDLRQLAREPEAQTTPARNHVPLLWVQVLSGWRYKTGARGPEPVRVLHGRGQTRRPSGPQV